MLRHLANRTVCAGLVCLLSAIACAQTRVDTTHTYRLDEVVVQSSAHRQTLRSATPLQTLQAQALRQTGAFQVSDAVKQFSGVVVKDYGGIGGLKTVSVRSLGATHTTVAYDGMPLSDAQTGQIDLGRLSLDNVERISLADGQADDLRQPARLLASAGILLLRTLRPTFRTDERFHAEASVKAGSFGLVNPSVRFENKLGRHFSSTLSAQYLHADGDYPYTLDNGTASERRRRANSDVRTCQGEANLFGTFDTRTLHLKLSCYDSERGLPTNILYNTYAGQRLWDRQYLAQAAYERRFDSRFSLSARAQYNHARTRYYDPAVLNAQGFDDNRYRQSEYYLNTTLLYRPVPAFTLSLAADAVVHHLEANLEAFASPTRLQTLAALSARYVHERLTLSAHLLATLTHEWVRQGAAAPDRRRLSPSVALSVQPFAYEGLRLRLLYKDLFRLPTFNDLYYGQVGTRTLRPEKARQWSGGLVWTHRTDGLLASVVVQTDAFFSLLTDKIVAVPAKNLFVWSMVNVGRVHSKGTEANLQADLRLHPRWTLQTAAAYTWQRALDKTDPDHLPYRTTYNHQIAYTPRHSGSVRLALLGPWVNLGYTALFAGERYSDSYNAPEYHLAPYSEHSLSLWREQPWGPVRLTLSAEILNVGGRTYEVVKNYPMPGRQVRASVKIRY